MTVFKETFLIHLRQTVFDNKKLNTFIATIKLFLKLIDLFISGIKRLSFLVTLFESRNFFLK